MIKLLKETEVVLNESITEDPEDGTLRFGPTPCTVAISPVMLEEGDYVRHYGDKQNYLVNKIYERFDDLDDLDSAIYFCQVCPVTEDEVIKNTVHGLASYIRLGA